MRSTEMLTDVWHKFIDYNDIPEIGIKEMTYFFLN